MQVSNAGGVQPRWRGDGKELYFYVGAGSGNIWSAGIRSDGGRVQVEQLRQLPVSYSRSTGNIHYDVTRDGQRFLMIQPPFASDDAQSQALIVISNWQAGLRK